MTLKTVDEPSESCLSAGAEAAPRFVAQLAGSAVVLALAIGASIFHIRPFDDVGERFIGHADIADVAIVARNLAEGRGAVTDAVWLLHGGGPDGPEITHPEGYWSIYVAAMMAPFFKLLGAGLTSLLLTSFVMNVLLAMLAYVWTIRVSGNAWLGTASGCILLTERLIANRVSGFSDLYLACVIFAAAIALLVAIHRGSKSAWFVVGIATGIAIGVKPSGLILLGLIPTVWFVSANRRRAFLASWPCLAGFAVAIAPLAVHNYRAAGTFAWPDAAVVASAGSRVGVDRALGPFEWDAKTIHIWNSAAYNPESEITSLSAKQRVRLHFVNLADFGYAYLTGGILPIWVLPFAFLAAVHWVGRRLRCQTYYQLFVATMVFLTIGSFCLGSVVHSEPRYFAYLIPFYVIVALTEAAALSCWLPIAQTGLVLAAGIPALVMNSGPLDTDNVPQYQAARELLPEDARVMTQNPWEFTFHTRRPSVVIPYNEKMDVLREIAARFETTHLVIVNQDVRHEGLDSLNQGIFPPFIEKVHESESLIIGRMILEQD